MKELVFNVSDIFNNKTSSGCLSQYNATCFHIPAYQRGYKWSTGANGAVTILLKDLWAAYQNQDDEYYLQYITVKPLSVESDSCYLEVIDGQQRLTTLSILLSVLSLLQSEKSAITNISLNKLDYAIRKNFFHEFIYQNNKLRSIADSDWESFISANPEDLDRQDIYYLYGATSECFNFFLDKSKDVSSFYLYLINSVKLIVNSVESHIQSETVFKNLNSNKVPLSESELVKALFITRVGRDNVGNPESHFREVMEVRLGLSRTWEDTQQWTQLPEVSSFYFDDKADSLHELIKLTALSMGAKPSEVIKYQGSADKPLFNYFSESQGTINGFTRLIEIKRLMADWFETDELYHLIGFCRFTKNSEFKNLNFLKECLEKPTKNDLKDFLIEKKSNSIFGSENSEDKRSVVKALKYGEDDKQIHAVLLALSVFSKTRTSRFDFDSFKRENWSLEHIFPQAPEGKGHCLENNEKNNIREIIGEVDARTESILSQSKRTPDEQKVYVDAIKSSGVIDNIGNMCLLTGGSNSALGCQFFDGKRQKILELIQNGSFVPKHTFDVFSKMLKEVSPDLKQWSKYDIEGHAKYISETVLDGLKDDLI